MRAQALSGVQLVKEAAVVVAVVAVVGIVSTGFVNWSFFGSLDLSVILKFYPALLAGTGMTVGLTAAAMIIATVVGILFAALAQSRRAAIRTAISAYVEVFRSVPILITLFWVHFALPLITGVSLPVLVSGLVAMVLQASAFMTDVMRAGIGAVPGGQTEAARSLGLTTALRWRLVVLPQALRIMLPSITNVLASMLKASAILSALSVAQLWQVAQQIGTFTFKPLEALTVAAIIYYLLGKAITSGMRLLERRLSYAR